MGRQYTNVHNDLKCTVYMGRVSEEVYGVRRCIVRCIVKRCME